MFDMNFKRRKREIEIAKEIALASFSATAGLTLIDARLRLIDQIDVALQRHQLDEASQRRVVLNYLPKEIDRMNAELDRANSQVLNVIDRLSGARAMQ